MAWLRGLVAVVLAVVLPAATARAQQPAAPPPAPYDAPAPSGATTPMQLTAFESHNKSAPLALVLEVLVPGVGSIYAHHARGAFITWAGIAGGIVLVVVGAKTLERTVYTPGGPRASGDNDLATGFIAAGVVALVGFRIYGLVDSWQSANAYNESLAKRLGLPPFVATVAPLRGDRGLAWGPALQLRF